MTDIQIPPEALEAAARALADDAKLNWDDIPYGHTVIRREARAACLAMLRAWPGGIINTGLCRLILPLTQETHNADNNP